MNIEPSITNSTDMMTDRRANTIGIVDVQVGGPTCSYQTVAVAPDMRHLVWLEGRAHTVWLCTVDNTTGDLVPLSGKGRKLGTLAYDSDWSPVWNGDDGTSTVTFPSADGTLVTVRLPQDGAPEVIRTEGHRALRRRVLPVRMPHRLGLDVAHVRGDTRLVTGPDRAWAFRCVRPPTTLTWQLHRIEIGSEWCSTVHQDIEYSMGEGKPLLMDIYEPALHQSAIPAIIYTHGGAWVLGTKSGELDMIDIQALVKAGFVVAAIDYRLSPEYRFPAQVEDVKCTVRYLRSHADLWGIDPPAHRGGQRQCRRAPVRDAGTDDRWERIARCRGLAGHLFLGAGSV
jgi:hypothetical protein